LKTHPQKPKTPCAFTHGRPAGTKGGDNNVCGKYVEETADSVVGALEDRRGMGEKPKMGF